MTGRCGAPAPHIGRPAAGTPITLPTDWSPEQAASVFDLIDGLRKRVWAYYGPQIQQVLREQQMHHGESASRQHR